MPITTMIAVLSFAVAIIGGLAQIVSILIRLENRFTRMETTISETHTARMGEIERRILALEAGKDSIERWIHQKEH